jgi:ABC-type glycerol-3-phosphate transport system substrate-binding protein
MTIISFLLFVCMISATFGSARAQSPSTDRAKLIEEAKKEGKVMVYISSNAADANALKAAFEKKYPFIKMEYYRTEKDNLIARYLIEARNGSYLPDVYQSSVFPIMTLVEKGLLAKYFFSRKGSLHRTAERQRWILERKLFERRYHRL